LTLVLHMSNPAQSSYVDEYVVLDVYGQYFFYPSWGSELDHLPRSLPAGDTDDPILDFTWPDGAGAADNLGFWGLLMEHESYEMASNISHVTFGYE
jgi:hypothetical protein